MQTTEATDQRELIAIATSALSDYLSVVTNATHDNRRPGLSWERPQGLQTRSCGAFRAWRIFVSTGNIALSADGYRVLDDRKYGGCLLIRVGEGHFVFPPDDSRSYHSLDLDVSRGCQLVNVTRERGPWTPRLTEIAAELKAATERIKAAVAEYDARKKRERDERRSSELQAAIEACSQ